MHRIDAFIPPVTVEDMMAPITRAMPNGMDHSRQETCSTITPLPPSPKRPNLHTLHVLKLKMYCILFGVLGTCDVLCLSISDKNVLKFKGLFDKKNNYKQRGG